MSDQQLLVLLEALDRKDNDPRVDARKFRRARFRTNKVVIHVLDAQHNIESSFRVVARNISADGLGFLHGQMLPPGKPVFVQIPRRDGEDLNLLAKVAHCRHVDGMIHEVGLKFVAFGKSRKLAIAMSSLQNRR
ncbi:MAG TPA: PilZ domain-containing protein [Phycisphaerae bacterium]|nr:PilZ domain-containing protein [Phycisphaerae bacterium]HQE27412.1 PilZ domain-containing protein [Phycisphaerae bacterium]